MAAARRLLMLGASITQRLGRLGILGLGGRAAVASTAILMMHTHHGSISRSQSSSTKKVKATADLCDDYEASLQVAEANAFKGYGQKTTFAGKISTIKCFENNPL